MIIRRHIQKKILLPYFSLFIFKSHQECACSQRATLVHRVPTPSLPFHHPRKIFSQGSSNKLTLSTTPKSSHRVLAPSLPIQPSTLPQIFLSGSSIQLAHSIFYPRQFGFQLTHTTSPRKSIHIELLSAISSLSHVNQINRTYRPSCPPNSPESKPGS